MSSLSKKSEYNRESSLPDTLTFPPNENELAPSLRAPGLYAARAEFVIPGLVLNRTLSPMLARVIVVLPEVNVYQVSPLSTDV